MENPSTEFWTTISLEASTCMWPTLLCHMWMQSVWTLLSSFRLNLIWFPGRISNSPFHDGIETRVVPFLKMLNFLLLNNTSYPSSFNLSTDNKLLSIWDVIKWKRWPRLFALLHKIVTLPTSSVFRQLQSATITLSSAIRFSFKIIRIVAHVISGSWVNEPATFQSPKLAT